MLSRTLAVIALPLLLAAAPLPAAEVPREFRQGDLAVGHPWARPSAGAQTNGAAYATIANGGDGADRLVSARSPAARVVELHTHTIDADGVARMRPVTAIDVPAQGEARLAPGGLHIMLIDLAGPLREGAAFPLTLVFERAGEVTVEVAVERPRPASAAAPHGGHHGGHAAPAH